MEEEASIKRNVSIPPVDGVSALPEKWNEAVRKTRRKVQRSPHVLNERLLLRLASLAVWHYNASRSAHTFLVSI